MRAIQNRCLKCGSVSSPSKQRVVHCTTCFADGTYLKPVVTEDEAAARPPADRAEPQPTVNP